jgi:feruloyl esterase
MRLKLIAAASAGAAALMAGSAHAQTSCADATKIQLNHASVTAAEVIKVGQVDACRISITSRPTKDSEIGIELVVPEGSAWNGKYLQVGNGGFAGQIPTPQIRAYAAQGYAVAGTDDGHQTKVGTSAAFALGHREKIADYGWRAIKETTEVSKAVLAASRGAPKRSYFAGCSDGGREALMEAQRFPKDFDGIVAGAPANYMSDLFGISAAQQQALSAPGGYLGSAQLELLQTAALKQCADGGPFIRDPASCHFDPAKLACKKGETEGCLTPAQLASAKAIYGGRKDPRTGKYAFPGFSPGAEAVNGSWNAWITGPTEAMHPNAAGYQFSSNAFKYFAFGDPDFDFLKLDLGKGFDEAKAKMTHDLDSASPDLTAFKARGGKLIHYHGWNDPAIPPRSSILYYEDVAKKMGDQHGFYRMYLVPGMLHCGGGRGPGNVDWVSLLDSWVTEGKAPGAVTASAPPRGPQPAVKSQLLCPFPQVAKGSGEDASGYKCAAGVKAKSSTKTAAKATAKAAG